MDTIYTYRFEGADGEPKIRNVMKMFRCGFRTMGGIEVDEVLDCRKHMLGYTKSEAVEYRLADGSKVVIRPSVTAPEITADITTADDNPESALETEARIREDLENIIHMDDRMGYCCE